MSDVQLIEDYCYCPACERLVMIFRRHFMWHHLLGPIGQQFFCVTSGTSIDAAGVRK